MQQHLLNNKTTIERPTLRRRFFKVLAFAVLILLALRFYSTMVLSPPGQLSLPRDLVANALEARTALCADYPTQAPSTEARTALCADYPTQAPSTEAWRVTSGSCIVDSSGCLRSPNFPHYYGTNEYCSIQILATGGKIIDVVRFDTESRDRLTVNGINYSGRVGPNGINPSGTILWNSDESIVHEGWMLCLKSPQADDAAAKDLKAMQADDAAAKDLKAMQARRDPSLVFFPVAYILVLTTLGLRSWRCEKLPCSLQEAANQTMQAPCLYDVVLKIPSLHEFVRTRQLQVVMSATSLLDMAKKERFRIVAVTGVYDKGKTFLINALFHLNLPSGKLSTTEGISMRFFSESRILIVDTAGCQAPVSYLDQNTDGLGDAQLTESFLFELVSRLAHHLVFVVSDFTWTEQKYINTLHQKYVLVKERKELVVIHNLKDTSKVDEAERLFESQLKSRYGGIQHINSLSFIVEKNPCIHHLGLCKVPSEAAERFNEPNLNYLQSRFDTNEVLGTDGSLGLGEILSTHCQEILTKFVIMEPSTIGCKSKRNQLSRLEVSFDAPAVPLDTRLEAADDEQYKSVGAISLKLCSGQSIEVKKKGLVSPLGDLILHDISFDPKVNLFDKPGGGKRFLYVECPGVTRSEITIERLAYGVELTIQKGRLIDESYVEAVEPIVQTHGVWHREFNFADSFFELQDDLVKLENGVLHLIFAVSKKGRLVTIPGGQESLDSASTHPRADSVETPPESIEVFGDASSIGTGFSGFEQVQIPMSR